MYSHYNEQTDIIKERLLAICRTELLAFGKEEFGRLIDHDLSKNSASKLKQLSPFGVNSIFHELCHFIDEETHYEIDLEMLMQDYEATSEYYKDSMKKTLPRPLPVVGRGASMDSTSSPAKDKVYALLDYIIMSDASVGLERNETWDSVWEKAEEKDNVDLRIVILLALGIIPLYSGKGKAEPQPLEAMKEFIHDYTEQEGHPLSGRTELHSMLMEHKYELGGRMPAVALFYHFIRVSRLSFSINSSRRLYDNLCVIHGLDVDDNNYEKDAPVIWYNDACPTYFWYMTSLSGAYYLVKCDYSRHTYTRFTLFLGSELEIHIGRILHPQSIVSLLNNEYYGDNMIMMSWQCSTDSKGNARELEIHTISPWGHGSEWSKEFNRFSIRRMSCTDKNYSLFEKEFIKGRDGHWALSDKYVNAFPGTEYQFKLSLYSVARDHILVQDVEEKNGEFVLVDNKYFRVDKDWVDDDLNLNDSVGLIIQGTDLPEWKRKKYIALDCKLLYLPIVNDEVIYPE